MTYLDIFSGAMSHFTNIPEDFIKSHLVNLESRDDKQSRLMKTLMNTWFPTTEGHQLLEHLKSKDLSETISFLIDSLNIQRNETIRQSILN